MQQLRRCGWAGTDPRMIAYHDAEWGVPVHDDRVLFEFLVLEGAQAGLVLADDPQQARRLPRGVRRFRSGARRPLRRAARRAAARQRRASCAIGSRSRARVSNARACLDRAARGRQLRPLRVGLRRRFADASTVAARRARCRRSTPESDALSAELKRRGFRFVGSTICYAFMQATGMVNDHLLTCPRYREIADA